MSAMGSSLRRTKTGIAHWCPACKETHHFKTDEVHPCWTFNGNIESPSFAPSMLIRWGKYAGHAGPGEEYEDNGICHYILTAGVINFCGDCTHAMAGQSVPLPDWPYAPGTYGGIEE